jgi:fumarate reductase (CoM/CoB) subunit A
MAEIERIDLDILIVGGGGAGAVAAIWAAQEVEKVGLVDKGVFGKSGCTPMGAFSMNAAFGYADPADNPWEHFKDTVKGGHFINNQELVHLYTSEAMERVNDLVSYGAKFDMENGKLHLALMPGHSHPRSVHYDRHTGPMIMGALARKVKRVPNVRLFEEVLIVDLRITPEGPHTAVGLRLADSSWIVFSARAVIVTTGSGAQIYKNNTTSLDNTGDGLSFLYEAGAELADMEFVQFYPSTVCFPKFLGLGPTATHFLRIRTGARLYNGLGEEFMNKQMPGWRFQATRDKMAIAIYREIVEGRGSPHGGVYLDVTHFPREKLEKEYEIGNYFHKLLQIGIDISKQPIETKVSAHFFMGGVRVNERGETNLPGLYAGGEAVAGYHGANRLGGNALSEILVSGARAGKYAALWAKDRRQSGRLERGPEVLLAPLMEKIARWKEHGPGLRPVEGKRRIQELMWEKAGVIRDAGRMKSGLEELRALQQQAAENLVVCPAGRFNRELQDAFELQHMIRICTLILTAALFREESRGAHYRVDFPEPDNGKWLANVLLKKSGSAIGMKTEKVKLTYLSPEE